MTSPAIAHSEEQVGTGGVIGFNSATSWAAGDLCFIWLATDGDNSVNTSISVTSFSNGSGLTVLTDANNSTASHASCLYRWIDGSESDLIGPPIDIALTQSEPIYLVIMKITGADTSQVLSNRDSIPATGATATPDPASAPSTSPANDVLIIAAAAWDHNDTWSSNPSTPDAFTTVQNGNSGTGAGDCGGAVAYVQKSAQTLSYNPGAFGISGSEEWVACSYMILSPSAPAAVQTTNVIVAGV